MNVLVTGSNGLIGTTLSAALRHKHNLSGLDISSSDGAPLIPTIVADVSDFDSVLPAVQGVDVVVHLAARVRPATPWSDINKNNISTTHNVFDACRQHNVRRVIFASSNHSVGLYENDEPYKSIVAGNYDGLIPGEVEKLDHTVPMRPDSDYAVSKLFGEATGHYYAEQFGLEVVCLRIGSVTRHNNPTELARHFATWLSHRDLVQLVERSLEAPLKFEIFYGVSNNTWRFWDISHAKKVLGYTPIDNAEEWRE